MTIKSVVFGQGVVGVGGWVLAEGDCKPSWRKSIIKTAPLNPLLSLLPLGPKSKHLRGELITMNEKHFHLESIEQCFISLCIWTSIRKLKAWTYGLRKVSSGWLNLILRGTHQQHETHKDHNSNQTIETTI